MNNMLRLRQIVFACLLAIVAIGVTAQEAFATHFRYGTITWSVQNPATPRVITLRFTGVFRWSYPWGTVRLANGSTTTANLCPAGFVPSVGGTGGGSCPPLGSTIAANGSFTGQLTFSTPLRVGTSATAVSTMTANIVVNTINMSEDWVAGTLETTLTIPDTVPIGSDITVTYSNCCRISSLQSGNNDTNYIVSSNITLRAPSNQPPTASTLPIMRVAAGQTTSFAIPAVDPDGDPLSYRFATTTESGMPAPVPPGMTINTTTGMVTYVAPALPLNTISQLHATQIVVTDTKGAYSVVDLLIERRALTGAAPIVRINGNTTAGNISTLRNSPVTFTVSAADPENTPIQLVAAGLPSGASLTPSLPVTQINPSSTFTWTPAVAGTYVINFSGLDGDGRQATNSVTINVANATSAAPTTTTLSLSPATALAGQTVTATATVDSGTVGVPPGSVQFLLDGVLVSTPQLTAGGANTATASFSTSTATLGAHTITATYVGATANDTLFQTSTASAPFSVVAQADTATTLTSTANPSAVGQPVSLTAIVVALDGVTATPTGTVVFSSGATQLGTAALINGSATLVLSSLPVGTTAVTAAFQGSASFKPSTSAVLSQVVNKEDTTTTLTTSPSPSTFLDPVTITATVAPVAPGAGTPTGTVSFHWNGMLVATVPLTGNKATIVNPTSSPFIFPTFNATSNALSAVYNGDDRFTSSTGATQHVVNKATAPTSLTGPATSIYGEPAAFTIAVGPPSDSIRSGRLLEGSTVLAGPALLSTFLPNGNMARTFTLNNLSVGVHVLTAEVSESQNIAADTRTLTHTVLASPTTTTISASPTSSMIGTAITVSAVVTAPFSAVAGGTVTFKQGGTTLAGPVALAPAGTAQAVLSTLPPGTHPIVAEYTPASGIFLASVSAPVDVTVLPGITVTSITLETRRWNGVRPANSAQAISIYNALPLGLPGYAPGPKTVTQFANISNQATFGGSNSNIGYHHHFAFTAEQAGTLTVRMGGDFGGGGTLIVDGVPIDFKGYDIWWNGAFTNPAQYLVGTINITPGPHVIDSYGFEDGLDGPQQAEYSFAGGPFTIFTAPANTVPVVTLSGPATAPEGSTQSYSFTVVDPDDNATFTAVVSCGVNGTLVAPAAVTAAGGTFDCTFPAVGTSTVSVLATDDFGAQSGLATRLVTIVDDTPPVLTLPQSVTLEATSAAGAAYTFTATAVDAIDPDVTATCSVASGSIFPLGVNDAPHTTTVTCTATDDAGNTASGSFTVTVQDTTAPSLTLPSSLTLEASSPAGADYTIATTALDVVDASVDVVCTPAGPGFPIGATPLSCVATDNAGNSTTDSFTVTVADTTAPARSCHGP